MKWKTKLTTKEFMWSQKLRHYLFVTKKDLAHTLKDKIIYFKKSDFNPCGYNITYLRYIFAAGLSIASALF